MDDTVSDPAGPVLWDIIDPVTSQELTLTMNTMKADSTGTDGMVLSQLKEYPKCELISRFNLWLLNGFCPSLWCMVETVLIPKDKKSPPKQQLITMANMLIRCFHKFIARRISVSIPISDR